MFEFQPKKTTSHLQNVEDQRRAESECSIIENEPEISNPAHKNDFKLQKSNKNQHPRTSNDLRREKNLDEIFWP